MSKIFFNSYVANEVEKKEGVKPEEINLDILYRDVMTMSLKLAKEIFMFRDSVRIAKESNENVLPNGLALTDEFQDKIDYQIKVLYSKLTIVRQFIVLFYDIPKLPDNLQLRNEMEDDIMELKSQVRILNVNSEQELVDYMKESIEERVNQS
jgi:hypothetical protein